MAGEIPAEALTVEGSASESGRVIEQRGIEYIPLSERHGRPLNLAGMWAGAVTSPLYVVYGALVVALGLSFAQTVVVILVGSLAYLLAGLASLPGPAAGTTAFGVSRGAFGGNGNRVVSLFNWFLQIGYEALDLSLVVLAALLLLGKAGVPASDGLTVAVIIVGGCLQGVLPLIGHAAVLRVLNWLVAPFVVLFAVLAVLVLPKVHADSGHTAGIPTMLIGLALVMSSGGLGWTMQASDYSRYLPPSTSRSRIVWSVTLGGMVPSALLMLLGAAVATVVPGAADPISGLPRAFASWFLVPYLLLVIVQLCAVNSLNFYSSAVTLQAIGLKVKRWHAVLIDTMICLCLTSLVIFSASFNSFVTDFLLFMIVWFAPWAGIFLVDWLLRRGTYDSRSLMDRHAGIYRRKAGLHIPGVVAQLVGMVASAMWLSTTAWQGPISIATDGSDLSVFMGFVVGGGLYYALARRSVRGEAALTPSPEENDRATLALLAGSPDRDAS
ncbi:purine-cytosine permease family protein [Streptomyces aureus]|uniref:Cytosine permease n=1 Tax=Streptomyces aureus TaxID=193461 RepID=A0ABV4SMM5_9ACTN